MTTYKVYVIDEKINFAGNEIWKPVYVGYSNNPIARWLHHRKPYYASRPVTNAIMKRGIENFRIRIINEYSDKRTALAVESALMNALSTMVPNGYNGYSFGRGIPK